MRKSRKTKPGPGEATQVFRQFAWNLAGTLVARPPKTAGGKKEPGR